MLHFLIESSIDWINICPLFNAMHFHPAGSNNSCKQNKSKHDTANEWLTLQSLFDYYILDCWWRLLSISDWWDWHACMRACVRADCPNPYYKYATYNPLSNSSLLDDDVHDWWWWGGDAWEIKKTIFIFERVLTPSNHRVPSPPPPSPAAVLLLLLLLFDCLKEDWCFLLWWGIHKFCFLN